MSAQLTLDLQPDDVMLGLARHFLADALGRLECGADPDGMAVLLADELLTNAIQAGAQSVTLRIQCVSADRVRVEVADDAAGYPQLQHVSPDSVAGRGLAIVDAIASAWGVTQAPAPTRGKTVWFEYAIAGAPNQHVTDSARPPPRPSWNDTRPSRVAASAGSRASARAGLDRGWRVVSAAW